ncbi:MAG TPA: signal peptidase I [Acidimicrobiales bacterium]|nr:signal peptidase I [Acidimicrobiales bacterium]
MQDDATGTRHEVQNTADHDAPAEPGIELPPSRLRRNRPRSKLRALVEWVVVVGGAFGLALLIQTFLFQPFRIPSGSMIPTLENGDRIVVNKLSYRLHSVNRGDVVVFTTPDCESVDEPKWANCGTVGNYEDLVKRVVAVPGDRLAIADDHVYVNGERLDEPYVNPGAATVQQPPYGCGFTGTRAHPFVIPDDMVFVMGDNRSDSLDSRCFGPIPESSLVGRAFVIIWPLGRLGWL